MKREPRARTRAPNPAQLRDCLCDVITALQYLDTNDERSLIPHGVMERLEKFQWLRMTQAPETETAEQMEVPDGTSKQS